MGIKKMECPITRMGTSTVPQSTLYVIEYGKGLKIYLILKFIIIVMLDIFKVNNLTRSQE